MKHLEYKGYTGTIEYSKEDELLFGRVMGIKGLISYEGAKGKELEADFKVVIDEYLKDCKDSKIQPQKPFKGSFNVRISSELHRDAALKAMELDTSLNSFVSEAIRVRLEQTRKRRQPNKKIPVKTVVLKKQTSVRKGKKLVKK